MSNDLKWNSVYDAPIEAITREFKGIYGREPTSNELNDILLDGKW